MYKDEFGQTFYTPQELQAEFKKFQTRIDSDPALRNRMSNEAYNSIQSIANYNYSAASKQKKKSSFTLYTIFTWLLVIGIIGFIIYVGMTF